MNTNENNLKTLKKRLLEERGDLTLSKLEEETGISHSTLGAIETGKRTNPNIDVLISLAKFFDCSIDYFVGLSDCKTSNIDDKEICEKMGLTETTFKKILEFEDKSILNLLIEDSLNMLTKIKKL